MAIDGKRVKAVASALRSILDIVCREDGQDVWDTAPYDNAISLLGDATGTVTDHLMLEDEELSRIDFLMHLESTLAFLEVYENEQPAPASIFPFRPREAT
jgi:hypothetical protein